MNDLARIDMYLNGQMTDTERMAFETSLRTDAELADALAFYVMARQSAKAAANDQRRAEWDTRRRAATAQPQIRPRIGQWAYPLAAAACLVLALGFGWFFLNKPTTTELADAYIRQNLTTLSVTMDGRADSLQRGIQQYNAGSMSRAKTAFGSILQRKPTDVDALKLAGLVALRQGNYDLAIEQFHRLGQRTDLYDNPGPLYEAVTRLKRNQPLDKATAKKLLTDLINKNLDDNNDAAKLLNGL